MTKLIEGLKRVKLINVFYFLAILIFLISIFIVSTDTYRIDSAREELDYSVVENYDLKYIEDSNTPQGVIKEYKFTLDSIWGDSVLSFYNVHNYVHVYIDDELVYQMEPLRNKMGDTLGLSWVVVPLREGDLGKEITIDLTPVYSNVVGQTVDFNIGSEAKVMEDIVLSDLPFFILSIFSVIIGVLLIIISIASKLNMKLMEVYPLHLGFFSILIGLWKGLDLFVTTVVIPGDPKTIFFISFYSLCLIPSAFIMYFKEFSRRYNNKVVNITSYVIVITDLALLFLQLLGLLDLREHLYLIHLLLLVILGLVAYLNIYLFVTKQKANKLFILTFMFSITSIIDIMFYISDTATRMMNFSFLLFLAYALSIGLESLTEKGRKAYIDVKTELYNSTYCQEIISNDQPNFKSKAVIMMDLNYLKKTNDLYGHDEGDVIIKDFADCIRSENNHNVVVGRIGGDEFVMIIKDTPIAELEAIRNRVSVRARLKNKEKRLMKLSYGFGYAYSADAKEKFTDLLKEADQEMYKNKKEVKEQEALTL